jgi:carboxylesterase type B
MYAWAPEDRRLSAAMQSYLVQFIASADPNTPGLPRWPAYASGQRMILDVSTRAETDSAAARGRVLEAISPTTAQPPSE